MAAKDDFLLVSALDSKTNAAGTFTDARCDGLTAAPRLTILATLTAREMGQDELLINSLKTSFHMGSAGIAQLVRAADL